MTAFWLIAGLLTLLALAALLIPLLRAPRADPVAGIDLDVLRDQKRELDADVVAGTLSADGAQAALQELQAEALAQADKVPVAAPTSPPRRWPWIAALAVALPAGALFVYLLTGTPEALLMDAARPGGAGHSMDEAGLRKGIATIKARLAAQPQDAEGWIMLGRSHMLLKEHAEGAAAYARASALLPREPALMADWAEAIALSRNFKLAGEPEQLALRALAIDPDQPKALAIAASAAGERGDPKIAAAYWRRLVALFPAGSAEGQQIEALAAKLEAEAKPGGAAKRAAPAKTAAETIRGRVSLAPALAAKVGPTDTLFIVARSDDGTPMPLAVIRGTARELPRDFMLDDSLAMSPARKLSQATGVRLEARVSKSGDARAQPGDLRGTSVTVKPGARGVKLVIDQVVP
ncbi:MAG: c-type cytochrome biogenesis protein CcmI [Burkholderiales bacterium]